MAERENPQVGEDILQLEPNIPRNKRGQIRWTLIKDNPELIKAVVENEARNSLIEVGSLSSTKLRRAGMHNLMGAVFKYYPGRMVALRQELNTQGTQHNPNFWNNPKAQEYIKEEILRIYQSEGRISSGLLRKLGRSDLVHAVRIYYPGKFAQLYEDLGLPQNHKPEGFWTPEHIRNEVSRFIDQYGAITHNLLVEKGRSDITNAIKKYPGTWQQLRRDLLLEEEKKPSNYWTVEIIEQEARSFVGQFGLLYHEALKQAGKASLGVMITKLYPGGMDGIRNKLGISSSQESDSIPSSEANSQLEKLLEEST